MDDPDPGIVLDLDVVNALRGLDGEGGTSLFEELVELFVEDAARLVAELEAAWAASDARTLERCAHTLKSSSASLGAVHLSSLCFELEKLGRSGALDDARPLLSETGVALRSACRALESLAA